MIDYLNERLQELWQRYKETADIRWLHRFNEVLQIRERLIIEQIDKDEKPEKEAKQ